MKRTLSSVLLLGLMLIGLATLSAQIGVVTSPSKIIYITGSPEGVVTKGFGWIAIDNATGNTYVKKSASGNTGWVEFAADAGGIDTTDIDTCAEFAAIMTGETGTCGALVFSVSPSLTTPTLGVAVATTLDTGQGANELFDMDQNVLSTSNVQFAVLTLTAAAVLPDNIRQTFNPGANAAGLNIGGQNADPDTPSDGDIYYDIDDDLIRARINGAWVNLGAGGGLAAADIDTCAEFAAIMTGETGTCGSLVLSAGPTFTGTLTAAAITMTGSLTLPDNVRVTFNPGADAAGLNVGCQSAAPGTPANGDIYCDSDDGAVYVRVAGAWISVSAASGVAVEDIDTVAELTAILTNEAAHISGFLTGTDLAFANFVQCAADTVVGNPTAGLADNQCVDYATLATELGLTDFTDPDADALVFWDDSDDAMEAFAAGAGVLNALQVAVNATGGVLTTDGTAVLLGKTLNCESTGNVCQSVTLYEWTAGLTQASTASVGFNLPASNPCAALAGGDGNGIFSGCAFDATTDEFLGFQFHLPSWFNASGSVDIEIDGYFVSATTEEANVCVQTTSVPVGSALTSLTFDDISCATATADAQAGDLVRATITGQVVTDWAASERAFVVAQRNPDESNISAMTEDDDATGDFVIISIRVIWRYTK